MFIKALIVVAAIAIPYVTAYSAGAPDSECSSMTPRHHVDPQAAGTAPYEIILSKKNAKAGETIQVTIKGKSASDNFKGLLVQARVGETPIGTFDASPSSQHIQLLDCGNSRGVSYLQTIVFVCSIYQWMCFGKENKRCRYPNIDPHLNFSLPSRTRRLTAKSIRLLSIGLHQRS